MEVDLLSTRYGKFGSLRLARNVDRGSLLFDANVLVTELQPAIVEALERCMAVQCCRQSGAKQQDVWTPEPAAMLTGGTRPVVPLHTTRKQ